MWKHQDARQIFFIGCPGFVFLGIACCLTVFALINQRSISSIIWVLAALGVILLFWFGIVLLQQRDRVKGYQEKRDVRAKAIRDDVLTGQKTDPFFVFLRPFDIDGKFYAAPSGIPADYAYIEEHGWPTADHDMESALANLVYSQGLLIAISDKPGEAGAGYFKSTDETWQDEVPAICAKAAGIFMVPFASVGTAWEVDLLARSGWLGKTFFVMPAEQSRRLGIQWMTVDYREMWSAGRELYQNLPLPDYDEQGEIFQLIGGEVIRYWFGSPKPLTGRNIKEKGNMTALGARLKELVDQVKQE